MKRSDGSVCSNITAVLLNTRSKRDDRAIHQWLNGPHNALDTFVDAVIA